MKKRLLALALSVSALCSCALVGCNEENSSKTPSGGKEPSGEFETVAELIENQAHEEKNGYKFCGYFEDEALSKRVETAVESVEDAENYYAKYQPDREQMFEYSSTYKYASLELENTIYGTNYMDVIQKYLYYSRSGERFLQNASAQRSYAKFFGNGLTMQQVVFGEEGLNKSFKCKDTVEYQYRTTTANGYEQITVKHSNKWNAYIGDIKGVKDGWQYYTVKDFAVIVGYEAEDAEATVSSAKIPSKIDGKEVKEVSIFADMGTPFNIKKITVPDTVENFMLYMAQQTPILEEISFAEGVQTIQIASAQTEKLNIPASAYYVDLRQPSFGYNAPHEYLYQANQELEVAEDSPHYYTENGFLMSAEGDLVHQFDNREKINLEIPEETKRVLRRSVNGIAKNIYIPAGVEVFDLYYNEYSARYNACMRADSYMRNQILPIYFIESEELLEAWEEAHEDEDAFTAGLMLTYPFVYLDGERQDIPEIDWHVMKTESGVGTNKQYDIMTGEEVYVDWIPYSYFDEKDAEKLYQYDSVLRGYYDFVLGYGEDEEIK